MQKEERNVGQVEGVVYAKYLRAAGGVAWAPMLLLLLAFGQAAQDACAFRVSRRVVADAVCGRGQ